MTTWEIEIHARNLIASCKDDGERRFLESVLEETLLLRSLKPRFYLRVNLFGEKTIGMMELNQQADETTASFEALKQYLERNK